ncbi:hypothetical protein [Thaumasiovibrio subtropicus]|uniref:hypothetical protein n=1 Tax=Thaumasiovibrio subtropicus TaxID=1891207 RepID=UPI000B351EA4|nr:hypothetical protein [Thaumasiovibrio subtropicus]
MSSHSRRGRPARDELESHQIEVARLFDQFKSQRQNFESNIRDAYPNLSLEQRRELRHAILGIAEELRLWLELDNYLLAVQRHAEPPQRLIELRPQLALTFGRLKGMYRLIALSSHEAVESVRAIFNDDYFAHLQTDDIKAIIEFELPLLSADEQSMWLGGYAAYLTQVAKSHHGDNTYNGAITMRERFRHVLLFIQHQRLAKLYAMQRQAKPGRPSVPQPVILLRAEQELFDAHQHYRSLANQRHIRPLSADELWQQHQRYLRQQSAGRKQMTPYQKLINRELQLSADLHALPTSESTTNMTGRGRRPKTLAEKRLAIQAELESIEKQKTAIWGQASAEQQAELHKERLIISQRFIKRQLKQVANQTDSKYSQTLLAKLADIESQLHQERH